ncbi:MAG: DNA-processing protein DprA [Candidatus Bipolaricaulota bacterium]|nr:DNA-processing protein DprA [Candidatus Bipolaricaulota bacterium]MDW8127111.1 DNA-processing protein DprA [Candidatus Bipolaricaulota bacterium]
MERKLAWVGLNLLPLLTPRRRTLLLERFGSPKEAWEALGKGPLPELFGEAAPQIWEERRRAHPEEELKKAEQAGAKIVTLEEAEYPQPLRELPDPPPVLYILGEWKEEDLLAVGMVGTRRCTSYGRLVAKKLAQDLAARGITVVSGMAPGIDTAAHEGALLSGRTLAVLGTGLGKPYPAGSEKLMRRIAEQGAVLSEFPWDMEGAQWTFPRRNRLIAGLSRLVVVVEAPERSGALITADYALEQGKEVLAVPGPITSEASAGANRLLREGAKPVTCVEDILEELNMLPLGPARPKREPELPPQAAKVYGLLSLEPLSIEEIVAQTGFSHANVAQILVELVLSGLVEELPGRRFMRKPG